MGVAKNHKKAFLQEHPLCIFCGGKSAATTIEHCPPRAMFQNRQWPEGFEFPACSPCNNGTDDQDLLVAILARMDPSEERGNADGKLLGLLRMAEKQYPGMRQKMLPTPTEARQINRGLGISPKSGQTHQETGIVKITEEMREAVCVFSRKISKAIFYQETKKIFPSSGCLLLHWFTNTELLVRDEYPAFEEMKDLYGESIPLVRNQKHLNGQFSYKLTISNQKEVFALQARFNKSFGIVVFGSSNPGLFEPDLAKLFRESSNSMFVTL